MKETRRKEALITQQLEEDYRMGIILTVGKREGLFSKGRRRRTEVGRKVQ